jgi:hypothetical protein
MTTKKHTRRLASLSDLMKEKEESKKAPLNEIVDNGEK